MAYFRSLWWFGPELNWLHIGFQSFPTINSYNTRVFRFDFGLSQYRNRMVRLAIVGEI